MKTKVNVPNALENTAVMYDAICFEPQNRRVVLLADGKEVMVFEISHHYDTNHDTFTIENLRGTHPIKVVG